MVADKTVVEQISQKHEFIELVKEQCESINDNETNFMNKIATFMKVGYTI